MMGGFPGMPGDPMMGGFPGMPGDPITGGLPGTDPYSGGEFTGFPGDPYNDPYNDPYYGDGGCYDPCACFGDCGEPVYDVCYDNPASCEANSGTGPEPGTTNKVQFNITNP